MVEIERKFLVKDIHQCLKAATFSYFIFQGYLSHDPARTVRLRITDKKAFLTIKGLSSEDGLTRGEWEKEISLEEGNQLVPLCLPGVIQKTRHLVPFQKQLFEVDVFEGSLSGLVIAELELNIPKQKVNLPDWIGEEVTGDNRYYNSYLAVNGKP